MHIIDTIGFLVSVAAMLYMLIKLVQPNKRSKKLASIQDDDPLQAKRLQDFLHSLNADMEKSKNFTPPSPKNLKPASLPPEHKKKTIYHQPAYKKKTSKEENKFKSNLDGFQVRNQIEERQFNMNSKNKYEGDYGDHLLSQGFRENKSAPPLIYKRSSRIKNLIHHLPTKKDLIVIHEVLNPPKGFRF
ncbi:hypothetical protein DB41_HL00100 [Neochlamydia sp. TUME1]|uniref:hypothetical protein n=1 Tax=Neochlamydia sp. TUME1 TaxID=1478174 RepID=UPI00057EA912|nr:hypothetical protein [Neochlamydia sp. TUME1]KIC75477.1 hypothetical protein DB41_HL00100 [Neochlamydia sp. TUME1]